MDSDSRIRERAYLLWEQAGCPHGCSEAFWFRAEADLAAEAEAAALAPSPEKPATRRRTSTPAVETAAKPSAPSPKKPAAKRRTSGTTAKATAPISAGMLPS